MQTIEEITRQNTLLLSPDTPIRRAIAQLIEEDLAASPVADDSGRLIGILSQKDCFQPALQASYYREWKGIVSEFMTDNVVSLPISTDLVSAAEAFQKHSYRTFPVLDGERFLGMLRRSDVLAQLLSMS